MESTNVVGLVVTLVYIGGGRSDRTVPGFRLVGLEVVGELPYAVHHLAFQQSVQFSLILSAFELEMLTLNILVAAFFLSLFLSVTSEIFYIKPPEYSLNCTSSLQWIVSLSVEKYIYIYIYIYIMLCLY